MHLEGNRSVDDRFQLRVDRIEVDGTSENDNVRVDHLPQDFTHIVRDNTFAAAFSAIVTSTAGRNLFIGDSDFFDFVAVF